LDENIIAAPNNRYKPLLAAGYVSWFTWLPCANSTTKRTEAATAQPTGVVTHFKKTVKRPLNILEIVLEIIALIWLLLFSFTLPGAYACRYIIKMDYPLLYFLTLILTLTASIFLIWRFLSPSKWIRKTVIIIGLPAILWTVYYISLECLSF
jgi:hypothetical protein